MKLKHHIQRITASLILTGLLIWLLTVIDGRTNERNFWLWVGLLCVVYQFISYVIIAIDEANEYPKELLTKEESTEIKEICKSSPFSQHEIFKSYKILKSFDLVREAVNLSIHRGEDLIHISNRIDQL